MWVASTWIRASTPVDTQSKCKTQNIGKIKYKNTKHYVGGINKNTGVNTMKYTQPLNTQVTYFLDFLYRFLSISPWYFVIGCNYSNGDNKYPEEKMMMMVAEQRPEWWWLWYYWFGEIVGLAPLSRFSRVNLKFLESCRYKTFDKFHVWWWWLWRDSKWWWIYIIETGGLLMWVTSGTLW